MSVLRAKRSFVCAVNGKRRRVATGELVSSDDPVVKGRDHLFEAVEAHLAKHAPAVERATAEPGERRAIGRPRKSAAGLTPESAPRTAAEAKAAGVELEGSESKPAPKK